MIMNTYDWFSCAKGVALAGQIDVDDVTEGIGGVLGDAKLALLGLSVEVAPLMWLRESPAAKLIVSQIVSAARASSMDEKTYLWTAKSLTWF